MTNNNVCSRPRACILIRADGAISRGSCGFPIRNVRIQARKKESACSRESHPLRRQNDELRSSSESSLCRQSPALFCFSSDGDYSVRTAELSPGAEPWCGKRDCCAFAERLCNPGCNLANNRGWQHYALVQTL